MVLYHGFDRLRSDELVDLNVFAAQEFIDLDLLAEMRPSILASLRQLRACDSTLWHNQNGLFSTTIQYIAMLAAGIITLTGRFGLQQLRVFGRDLPYYLPLQETEGEVVRRFEWFPECFYPRYVRQIANSLKLEYASRRSRQRRVLVRARAKLRPFLLDTAKVIFFARRNWRLFGPGKRSSTRSTAALPAGDIDTLLLLRSHAGIDFHKNYAKWLRARGRKVILVIGEQLQRSGILEYAAKELADFDTVHLPRAEGARVILREYFHSRLRRPTLSVDNTVSLRYGPAQFEFEVGLAAKFLYASTSDQRIYRSSVATILDQLGERTPACLSAEIVSHYVSIEAEEALARSLVYWNTEPGPFDKRHVLRLAPGTGYAVQTIAAEQHARATMQCDRNRIHHPGCISHPWLEAEPSDRKSELRSLVFYTQPKPSNEENNRLIGDALVELAEAANFDLVVKAHPRDFYDYARRWKSSRVIIADRLGTRSERLTLAADCVVSSVSNTLSEALFNGIPYMAVLLEHQHRHFRMESISEALGVRHYSIEQMASSLRNFSSYARSHYTLRKQFLLSNVRMPLRELNHLFEPARQ